MFGGVEAEAWSYYHNKRAFNWGNFWWGMRLRVNHCWGEVASRVGGSMGLVWTVIGLIGIGGKIISAIGAFIFQFVAELGRSAINLGRACRNYGWSTLDINFWRGYNNYC